MLVSNFGMKRNAFCADAAGQQHLGSGQKFWALVLLEFVGQPDRMCDVEPDKLPTRTLPLTCPLDRGFTCIEASGWRSVLSVWH